MKMKLLVALAEDGDPKNVGWQEVGRELDALEGGADRAGQRFSEYGFAGTGEIFKQYMAAAGESGQQLSSRFRLALHHPGDIDGHLFVNLSSEIPLCNRGNVASGLI